MHMLITLNLSDITSNSRIVAMFFGGNIQIVFRTVKSAGMCTPCLAL